MPQNVEKILFPVADGTVKLSGGYQVFRRSSSTRDHPARGEEYNDVLQGESDGSQPSDTLRRTKPEIIFGPSLGFFLYRHHVEPRVELHVPTEESFSQYHSSALTLSGGRIRHWMCCWRDVLTIIGTLTVAGNHRSMDRFHAGYKTE